MSEAARDMLVTTLKSLLTSSDYSDFTISCGAEVYKVHKAIVCSRSEFFRRAERFPDSQDEARDKVDLSQDDSQAVKLLIQYMYEGGYDPKSSDEEQRLSRGPPVVTVPKVDGFRYDFPHTCVRKCPNPYYKICPHRSCQVDTCGEACKNFICLLCCETYGSAEQLILHAKMYEIGDRYIVEGLKELAEEKFRRSCNAHWDTEHFAPAAHYAFSTTPEGDEGLRDIVSKTIADHIDILNKPAVEALLHEYNGLAVGLLKMKAQAIGWTRS